MNVTLLTFGGDVEGADVGLKNAFTRFFACERNLSIWSSVSISPFARKCLEDKKSNPKWQWAKTELLMSMQTR